MTARRRHRRSSWASTAAPAALLVATLASEGRAFAPSPLPPPRTARRDNDFAARSRLGRGQARRPQSATSLQALSLPGLGKATCFAPPVASVALSSLKTLSALTATVAGGAFAGSLHAVAGPDHLAALIPRCCGLPWHRAARVGAVWGLGHGVSATLLGMAGYLFKTGVVGRGWLGGASGGGKGGFDVLHHAGSLVELAVGLSLVVIGLMGIKEAREWESPSADKCDVLDEDGNVLSGSGTPQSLSAAAAPPLSNVPDPAKRAVLLNGILHGFSWDGAPSLAPAVAVSTWRMSLTFLLSYAVGTTGAMALATLAIGEGTRRAAGKLERPDLPRDLSVASSALAVMVGGVWCYMAL
ncbi:hypothetical protein ACHAWF_013498 [Thalassiosira exigua]